LTNEKVYDLMTEWVLLYNVLSNLNCLIT
jgi:hypothetical protein